MAKKNDVANVEVTTEFTSATSSGSSKQKRDAIDAALKQIQKNFGDGSVMRLGTKMEANQLVPAISTQCLPLDLALGVGGFPRGRVIEIYGPEASGKTTVCLHVIAEAQKNGGVAAFIDAEHALDPERARAIGVNLDDLYISQPDNGEQALEIAETLIRSGGLDVIVIDSVAALVPKAEIEGEMGDASVGAQARLMSKAMRKLSAVINKSQTVVIFTNQLRLKIGVMFGNPETTSGGQALKFYASIRIDMRKIGNIQEGDGIVGTRHRARVVKNKVAAPFRTAEFDMMATAGISVSGSVLDVATEMGIVEKAGSFFKYGGQTLAQGRENAKNVFEEKPELMEEIRVKVWDKIRNDKAAKAKTAEPAEAVL
jgi:recombination protein RecA